MIIIDQKYLLIIILLCYYESKSANHETIVKTLKEQSFLYHYDEKGFHKMNPQFKF